MQPYPNNYLLDIIFRSAEEGLLQFRNTVLAQAKCRIIQERRRKCSFFFFFFYMRSELTSNYLWIFITLAWLVWIWESYQACFPWVFSMPGVSSPSTQHNFCLQQCCVLLFQALTQGMKWGLMSSQLLSLIIWVWELTVIFWAWPKTPKLADVRILPE